METSKFSLLFFYVICLAIFPTLNANIGHFDHEKNRKRLADCALGFGHDTIGGKDGKIYVVKDSSNNDLVNPKPGTLRHAAIQKEPLWIIFYRSMNIKLHAELMLTDNKTIDARGANVNISEGAQITLQYVRNIIIHGLHIHDIKKCSGGLIRDSMDHYGVRAMSDGDAISVFGSTHIWIDHVLLFGVNDSYSGDKIMQVSLAFNHFGKGLIQRMPRCRWGFFHIVNKEYTHWLMYAIVGSQQPTIISQGNRFVASPNPNAKEVTKKDYAPESVWKNWNQRSEGDLMVNGAFFVQSGKSIAKHPKAEITAKPGKAVASLTRFAGPLKCELNKPC
uniref:Pectate lyase n=1 Tax=Glycine max TaxID=3847 RepID=K7KVW7_SOYBN